MPDINKAYSWAIETCNAPNVRYSQTYRNQQTINGITYYDCSSFINYALLAGEFSTPGYAPDSNAFTSGSMINVLLLLGFKEVDASGEYLPGDIGWVSGHTEMCYKGGTGKGVFMGAHTDNAPPQYQVSIGSSGGNPNYERSFTRLFRYGDGGATGYGVSIYVVSAMCGNFWHESGINPGIWENLVEGSFTDLGIGYGLGQWTNTGGDTHGRLYKLSQWLLNNGYAYDSGEGQLSYLIEENVWYPVEEAEKYQNLQGFLNSDSTDIEDLTHAFTIGWEGIHASSWDERVQSAWDCYYYILEHANDTSIVNWYVGNEYLSNEERLHNAVLVYRFLSAGGGGGGTPGKLKNKMPVWMMIKYNRR